MMAMNPKSKAPVSKSMIRRPKVTDLPFVAERGGSDGRDFWHDVQSTGDMIEDQELGAQLSYFTLQVIKSDDFPPLLGWVVLGMIKKQAPTHIVVGFFYTIAEVCLGCRQIPPADMALKVPASMQRANPKRRSHAHDRAA